MRKAISIFFILLANMVILAHTVVPHHHHNKAFAAVVSLFDNDYEHTSEHHHGTSHQHGTNHHHDNSNQNSEECLINEVYVATYRAHNDDCTIHPPLLHDLDWHPLFVLPSQTETIPIQVLPFRQKPYIEIIHLVSITHSSGLRAPPYC